MGAEGTEGSKTDNPLKLVDLHSAAQPDEDDANKKSKKQKFASAS